MLAAETEDLELVQSLAPWIIPPLSPSPVPLGHNMERQFADDTQSFRRDRERLGGATP